MRLLREQFEQTFDYVFYLHVYDDVMSTQKEDVCSHYIHSCMGSEVRMGSLTDISEDVLISNRPVLQQHQHQFGLHGYTEAEVFYDWVLRVQPFLNGRDLGPIVLQEATHRIMNVLPQTVQTRVSNTLEQRYRERVAKREAHNVRLHKSNATTSTTRNDSAEIVCALCDMMRVPRIVLEAIPCIDKCPSNPLKVLGVDAIFVLNLRRRPDRLCQTALQLARIGISMSNVHVIEAFDGTSDKFQKTYEAYRKWVSTQQPSVKNHLDSAGALACYHSYLSVSSYILEKTDHQKVLFLEDDVYFHKDFWSVWHSAKIPTSADIVRIGANQQRWDHCNISGGVYPVPKVKYHWALGTFGFIVNRKLLNALRTYIQPTQFEQCKGTIDLLIWYMVQQHAFTDIALTPNVVAVNVNDSDIRESRDTEEFYNSRKWRIEDYWTDPITMSTNPLSKRIVRWLDTNGQRTFVFVIPSYNNEDWVERNLTSVCNQSYTHWRAIYVDDASTDSTFTLAKDIVQTHGCSERFTFIQNKVRKYQAHARHVAYTHPSVSPDEVAVFLDGDDWLIDDDVLCTLDTIYRKHDVVCTYGQYVEFEDGETHMDRVRGWRTIPKDVVENNDYRNYQIWVTQHLRTSEMSILQQIPSSYLQYEGEWIRCCTDVAEMLFILERSDGRHKNAGRPLLIYNKDNSKRYPHSYYNKDRDNQVNSYRITLLKYYYSQRSSALKS